MLKRGASGRSWFFLIGVRPRELEEVFDGEFSRERIVTLWATGVVIYLGARKRTLIFDRGTRGFIFAASILGGSSAFRVLAV